MFLHLVQLAIDNHRPQGNRERAAQLVRAANVTPQSLIVLPELFSTGTLPPDFHASAAEEIVETDRRLLAALARETRSHVLAGILEVAEGKLFNLCVLFDASGSEMLGYRKIHPFSLGGEDKIFTGGASVSTAAVEGFTLQAAVCYDLRFPELFRAGSRHGADLFAIPANWPESRKEHWEVLLRARAIENQSFVAGVNCVGTQRGTVYAGGSMVVSPKGEVLAAGGEGACVVSAEISAEHVRNWRRVFPALRDRRPDGFWTGQ
jgi:predicted amidohydrolase